MSENRDDRIVEFLRAGAPPERDPMFRLEVLERRERRQLRRRAFTLLAAMLAILAVSISPTRIGGGSGLLAREAVVAGTALAGGYLAFRGQLLQILRRLTL